MGKKAAAPDDGQGAVTAAKLAEMLSQVSGSPVTPGDVADDVAAGAPTEPDGTIPLLPYVCWLYRMAVHGGT